MSGERGLERISEAEWGCYDVRLQSISVMGRQSCDEADVSKSFCLLSAVLIRSKRNFIRRLV